VAKFAFCYLYNNRVVEVSLPKEIMALNGRKN
jgi:hypothetical protein